MLTLLRAASFASRAGQLSSNVRRHKPRTLSSSAETEFRRQLEIFHSECDAAVRYFYAGRAIHASLFASAEAIVGLNRAPIFWNTAIDALRTSTLVTLGRVFDPNPQNHSLTRLIAFGHANLQIFSRSAVEARVSREVRFSGELYVATASDFRRIKKLVATRRREYETTLRPWRHELYAHRVVRDPREFRDIPQDIDAAKLQKLVSFLPRLHGALWQLVYEGKRPVLRPTRHSVDRMLQRPSRGKSARTLQERVSLEVNHLILSLSGDA